MREEGSPRLIHYLDSTLERRLEHCRERLLLAAITLCKRPCTPKVLPHRAEKNLPKEVPKVKAKATLWPLRRLSKSRRAFGS
jgi:hypothetical protein